MLYQKAVHNRPYVETYPHMTAYRHDPRDNPLLALDLIRDGFIGAALGLLGGLLLAWLAFVFEPFGPDMPLIAYIGIVFVTTCHGAWMGGLTGVASRNKKLANFSEAIDSGQFLVLIYAKKHEESNIQAMMATKHREARLAAVDPHFFNPFANLQLMQS